MKLFASELQYLSELYLKLSEEFSALNRVAPKSKATALAESIIRNRDLLFRIEQMNQRLSQLAEEWERFRARMDPASRAEVQSLAQAVFAQAVKLKALCSERIQELESGRRRLEDDLGEVKKGTRYLQSAKPPKTNYPKFVDSLG